MTFGEALKKMETGAFVAREGWNGKNQFIFMVEGVTVPRITLNRRTTGAIRYWDKLNHLDTEEEHSLVDIAPYIAMINVQGELVRGWLVSQTDMTANDWYVRDYAQNNQETTERLEPHVFAAMEYEAKKKTGRIPSAPPTFEQNPALCEKCEHPTGSYTTCHDCENGSNYKEIIEDLPQCPYNNTGNHEFCFVREKNRCMSSGSNCFKQGMELKEKEDGTQSN